MEKCHNALIKQNQSENMKANEKLEYENKLKSIIQICKFRSKIHEKAQSKNIKQVNWQTHQRKQ